MEDLLSTNEYNYHLHLFERTRERMQLEKFTNLYLMVHDNNRYTSEQKTMMLIQRMMLDSIMFGSHYIIGLTSSRTPEAEEIIISQVERDFKKLIMYFNHNKKPQRTDQDIVILENLPPHKIQIYQMLQSISPTKDITQRTLTTIVDTNQKINNLEYELEENQKELTNYVDPRTWITSKKYIEHTANNIKTVLFPTNAIVLEKEKLSTGIKHNQLNIWMMTDIIGELEQNIEFIKSIKQKYINYEKLLTKVAEDAATLRNKKIKYELLKRGVMLDTEKVKVLPDDIKYKIQEYLGKNYLENIRQYCIRQRYFPGGVDEIISAMKTWKKRELLKYSQQVYLKYQILPKQNRIYANHISGSSTKETIIANITKNTKLFTFPEFIKDVYVITKSLQKPKPKPKTRTRSKTQVTTLIPPQNPQTTV